jgi:hypothetical protein
MLGIDKHYKEDYTKTPIYETSLKNTNRFEEDELCKGHWKPLSRLRLMVPFLLS